MKVKVAFYCMKEKKSYKRGDEYKGKRKDLTDLLWTEAEEKADADTKDKKRKEIAKNEKEARDKIGQFGKAKHENKDGKPKGTEKKTK